ncbi:unnamed protein product [Effrenium voratum]|uniref:Uncharacterized protein n=1 Tax=Effrenium voratum TaxID=2562239 RepID=A0AA36J7R9_9DINO|nr:unnamed protein product [Effrenium voratum]CAJ1414996.1 unnamed protein product [Effrenium voratum]
MRLESGGTTAGRRLREQELRESLEEQKKAPFGDVDLEVLISCLVKSELDGMEDIAQQAKEMCQQRLAEASAAARDGDRDQAERFLLQSSQIEGAM